MIETLKKGVNKKKIVAILLFGAIIVVFVFFGYEGNQGGNMSSVGYAARVNNKIISIVEFQNSLAQVTQFYSKILGDQLNQSPEMMANIRNSALDQLIEREVVVQGANQEGFQVTNEQVRDFLLNVPAFQKEGVFQRSYYESYLQNQKMTASRFEDQLKGEFVAQQIRKNFSDAFEPFESELAKIQKLKAKSYTFDYIRFDEKSEKDLESLKTKILDLQAFDSEIQKLGLKWKTTAPVTLDSDSIQEIGFSEKLMQSAFKLSKKGETVPEIIQTAQGQFAIRLNKIEEKNAPETVENLKSQLKSQRGNEAFANWSKNLAKGFSIEKNNALLGATE